MSETQQSPGDDDEDVEILQALQAAFGDDVSKLLTQENNDSSPSDDIGSIAAWEQLEQFADDEQSTASKVDLDHLLTRLSSVASGDSANTHYLSNTDQTNVRQAPRTSGPRHIVFEVGEQWFGLPLSGVREIDRYGNVTALPRTPSWLRGVTNLRGQILSVTDFRRLLNLSDDRKSVSERIIVVHSDRHAAQTALVVDRVIGIRSLKGENAPLNELSGRIADFANGIAIAEESTTVLLDPDQLLGCSELRSYARQQPQPGRRAAAAHDR